MDFNKNRPRWLKSHPKEFIFKLKSSPTEHNPSRVLGRVWYRPLFEGFEIDYFEIDPRFRQQGNGKKLLYQFIEFCQTSVECKEVWLEVSVANQPAKSLYLNYGFQPVHLRPKYYDDGTDAVVMTLKLQNHK